MNIILAFLGWLIWSVGNFVVQKDDDEDDGMCVPAEGVGLWGYFKPYIVAYEKKNLENQIFGFCVAVGLIFFGIAKLGLDAIPVGDVQHLQWNDTYYFCSGIVGEVILKLVRKYRKTRKDV